MADKSDKTPPKSADDGPSPADNAADLAATGADPQADVPLIVNGQYIKDLSFEAPTTPGIFALIQQDPPDVNINVDVKAQGMQNNVFEVVLVIKAECKTGDSVAFILELSYGGVFTLNVPQKTWRPCCWSSVRDCCSHLPATSSPTRRATVAFRRL